MDRIPLLVPTMPDADALLPWLRRIDEQRWYTNFGPLSREFEERLLQTCALPQGHAVALANATVALELLLQAYALPAGARVLLPALTFVATATAVRRAGLTPLIADVDPRAWSLTPELARQALDDGPIDAVLTVATFGRAQDPAAWDEFARSTGLPVAIDAAGAYGNQRAAARADVVFSFHATKALGAGEGGALLSTDAQRVATVRRLANFGIDTRCGDLVELGTNGKLSEYHAAVALASLGAWEGWAARRRELHARYRAALGATCPGVQWQEGGETGVYPLLAIALPGGADAGRVAARLAAQGIETRRWYCPPLHRHPALREAPRAGSLATADDLGTRLLGLPFFLGLQPAQVERICAALADALRTEGVS